MYAGPLVTWHSSEFGSDFPQVTIESGDVKYEIFRSSDRNLVKLTKVAGKFSRPEGSGDELQICAPRSLRHEPD